MPDHFPPRPPQPNRQQIYDAFNVALFDVQQTAVTEHSKRPFAAILLAPNNTTVLLTHFSIDHVNHAESCLARLAALHYSQAYLWTCTLVSTWEPCAMCSGTIYWANIGRVMYGAGEEKLKEITGEGNAENFTMSLGCRDVFAKGQKDVQVIGPVRGWDAEVAMQSDRYWKPIREKNALNAEQTTGRMAANLNQMP